MSYKLLRAVCGRRQFLLLSFTFVAVLLYFLIFYSILYSDASKRSTSKHPKPGLLNDSLPVILLWTPYFGGPWIEEDGFKTKCLENKCRLVTNRAYINIAAAVLFHWRDVNLNDLPNGHHSNQKWVLYNMESPDSTKHLSFKLEALKDDIDWMMSYRLDSDVVSPYGYTRRLIGKQRKHIVGKKSKEIAWMVSNCRTPSKREQFAKQLSEYVNVDIFGRCGTLTCPKEKYYKCLEMVGREYKFYLSFENSICKDYVTEKLFRIMAFDVIPIVFGGANYTNQLPPNSFIDALSFSSVRQLANYVQRISNNHTIFSSFFDWKTKYQVFSQIGYDLCSLCDKLVNTLRDEQTQTKSVRDIVKWWYNDANCISWNSDG